MIPKHLTPTVLCRVFLLPALVLTVVPNWTRAGEGTKETIRSLDLTLPREAPGGAWTEPPRADAIRLPELGGRSNRPGSTSTAPRRGGLRSDLPYGAGYEARRGGNERGSSHGVGAGRGRGR